MTSCVLECFLLSLTLLILFCVQESWQLLSGGQGSEDEARLLHDLFDAKGYNPLIRPVRNINETIQVNFSLALSQLINIDEKNQIMKANVWLQLYWNDYQLQWDPVQYGNIGAIRLPSHTIWTPDIVLFNNADGEYEASYKSNCVVYSGSSVNWIPPAIYKSACEVDVKYFPFDEQVCTLSFGSWTYTRDQLAFTWQLDDVTGEEVRQVVIANYVTSGTWDVVEYPQFLDNSHDPNAIVIFQFRLRRKRLFYVVNLLIPCALISCLNAVVFALPADASEKITFCISILVTLVVFMLLVTKILPPSLTIPLISKFLLFTFMLNVFSIIITVIVINRNYRTPRTHPMPDWIRVIFLNHLPRFLLMKRPDHETRWRKKNLSLSPFDTSEESLNYSRMLNSSNVSSRADLHELTEIHRPSCRIGKRPASPGFGLGMLGTADLLAVLTPEVQSVVKAVHFITENMKQTDAYDSVLEDWKYVALVLDRFLLYIFLIVTIGGVVGMFLSVPKVFQ